MWSTEIIVFSIKISWKTRQLYFFTFYCRQSIGSICFLTDCQRSNRLHSCCPTVKRSGISRYCTCSKDLRQKIHTTVFVSQKIEQDLKLREAKTPIVNQRCLVYKFRRDLCDAGYGGFARRHLHQRVQEHRSLTSPSGKHFRDKHSLAPGDLTKNFSVLKKCTNKFDCLLYEMFLFKNWDLLSMCSQTQFVRKFLIRFLIVFNFLFVFN